MSQTLTISDEAYRAIAVAAAARGEAPEAYLEAFALALERDPEPAWFWTTDWQAGEREADQELAAGRAAHFESADAFLRALDDRAKHADV
jgi:hypothetical protein